MLLSRQICGSYPRLPATLREIQSVMQSVASFVTRPRFAVNTVGKATNSAYPLRSRSRDATAGSQRLGFS